MTTVIKFRYLGRLFVLTADRLARLVLLLAMNRNEARKGKP